MNSSPNLRRMILKVQVMPEDKEKQSDGTKTASEPHSDVLKVLTETVDNMQKEMGNVSREVRNSEK